MNIATCIILAIVGLFAVLGIMYVIGDIEKEKIQVGLETAKLSLSNEGKKVDVSYISPQIVEVPEEFTIKYDDSDETKKLKKAQREAFKEGFHAGFYECKRIVVSKL